MRRLLICLCGLASVPLCAQYKNTKLTDKGGEAGLLESSIAITTKYSKKSTETHIVATVAPGLIFYSTDLGNTWGEMKLNSEFGMAGDPALVTDVKGHIQLLYPSDPGAKGSTNDAWLDRIVCQTSEDGGATWSEEASIGSNPLKDQKWAWPTVHPKKQIVYTTYTQFDKYGLNDTNCHSNILFSMSTNAGRKWDKPHQVSQTPGNCLDDDNTAAGAVPAVGIDGRIFVTWSNQGIIFFDRSYDEGKTWLTNDLSIGRQVGGWSMTIPGFGPISSRPLMMTDNGLSRSHGCLYVVYADQKFGADDTDIWFIRSTNRGDNWTAPYRVNHDDAGKHQFSPMLAVDQVSGHIFVAFMDRRAYDDMQTDVYLAFSKDGGNSFREVKISETSFVPAVTKAYSKLCGIAAHDGLIALTWTRTEGDKSSVWSSVIKEETLPKEPKLPKEEKLPKK